ncbi:MAG: hypothetical protein LBK82_04915 [Planctomycetaceae bacterium]|nr:hypothetical protein [Planctomycetaceae bacterium]
MQRFCFSFCVVVLAIFGVISVRAQEKVLQETPELLVLITETHQLLESLPDNEKEPVLFQLLSLELRFTDKQQARNTIQQVLKLIPSVEKESVQSQILEAVAVAQADLGDYAESVKTLDLINKPSVRAEKQLNVAEKIIGDSEKNKTEKNEAENLLVVAELLRKSLNGAVEAKDAGLESLVSVILAHELAKQGKIEESKILFEKSRIKAREIVEIEERNIVALMVRSLIHVDRQTEALAMIETITDEENKLHLLGAAAIMFAQEGKITDAENIVKLLKQDKIKDNTLIKIVQNAAKTITLEQILALAKQTSSLEYREMLLRNAFNDLLENNRADIAAELLKHLEIVTGDQRSRLHQYHLKPLIDAGKFDEAAQFIETLDTAQKQFPKQQLLMAKIKQQGGLSEELLNQIEATISEEEKKERTLLQQQAEKATKFNNFDEILAGLNQVFPSQIEMLDFRGIRKTLGWMLEAAEKSGDPHKIIQIHLGIVELQVQMYDKSGVKKNLYQLQQFLDGIKDVRILNREIFPDGSVQPETTISETATPSQPILKLNSPADETKGKDNLFQVYCSITFLWYQIGESEEAKKSFQKAKDIIESETDTIRKIDKLLALSQLLDPPQFD